MKLLFDENTSFRVLRKITDDFPDSIHVSQVNLLASRDSKIFEFAKLNGYAIVTYDEDYHALSIIHGFPPKVIWIRAGNLPTNKLAQLIIARKTEISDFLSESEEEEYGFLEVFII